MISIEYKAYSTRSPLISGDPFRRRFLSAKVAWDGNVYAVVYLRFSPAWASKNGQGWKATIRVTVPSVERDYIHYLRVMQTLECAKEVFDRFSDHGDMLNLIRYNRSQNEDRN